MTSSDRERLTQHLIDWLKAQQDKALAALFKATNSPIGGAARGLIYQLSEQLGSISRIDASEQVDALSRDDRRQLKSLGVLIGRSVVYMPALLKPAAVSLRARLWNIWQQPAQSFEAPAPGLITIDIGTGQNTKSHKIFLNAIGFQVFNDQAGWFAVRLDMVERIASAAWDLGLKKPFAMDAMLMSLAGASEERTAAILCGIGFRKSEHKGEDIFRVPRPNRPNHSNKPSTKSVPKRGKAGYKPPHNQKTNAKSPKKPTKYNEDSPFAVLRKLTL
jgi:ATP-dependent RNA helicase SUPV3L1/SUV3